MKSQILQTLAALALIATSATAQDNPMENHTASYIAMPAAEGQSEAFAEFLAGAAPIVRDTEPRTDTGGTTQQRRRQRVHVGGTSCGRAHSTCRR